MPRIFTEAMVRLIKSFASAAAIGVLALTFDPASAAADVCGEAGTGVALGTAGGASFACGPNAQATSLGGTAIGEISAAGFDGTALGNDSKATGSYSTAAGLSSRATGDLSTAIGVNSSASGYSSLAIGSGGGLGNEETGAHATAELSIAIGQDSVASGVSSLAVGTRAAAASDTATAIGTGATAGFANSTAIGSGATATAANQVAIGTASNTYRMAGVASAASLAAQSGPVSFVTTDAAGNLATSSFNPASITSLQSQVTSLQSQVMDNRFEARSGTAVALAAGSMPALQAGRKFALSTGYGNFEGANAFAVGATALLYDGKSYAIVANAGGGIGLERNVAGGRGAVSIQW